MTFYENMYGRVEGDIDGHHQGRLTGKRSDWSPFDTLLALCRVFGLYYEILSTAPGQWTVSLSTSDSWPADFYGGSEPRHRGKRTFTVCGSRDPVDGLHSALTMAWSELQSNCGAWRRIVSNTPPYDRWFPK